MKRKYKTSYDEEGDIFTIYTDKGNVKESIEVAENLVIDIDKDNQIINFELFDAYEFLNTLNKSITKNLLGSIQEVNLEFKNFRNLWIITILFKQDNKIIAEKLPAFSDTYFESPLIASAKA